MDERTKVKITGGAASRRGKTGVVITSFGTGKNIGKVEIYIDRLGDYWYDPKDLEIIEESPPSDRNKPKIVNLKIELIRVDGGTQIREKINERTVEEYAEDMKEGTVFPPIVVFKDSSGNHWLSDGFHRLLAAAMAERNEISVEVREGSLRNAILYSCGANAKQKQKNKEVFTDRSCLSPTNPIKSRPPYF